MTKSILEPSSPRSWRAWMISHWPHLLTLALLVILVASLTTYKLVLPAADDLPRHLENGKLVLQGDFSVLYQNLYSYTEPTGQFTNHHWFFGVLAYLLYLAVGWNGLVIVKVLLLIALFLLLFAIARQRANFWLVALVSLPVIIMLAERSSFRPELLSYLLIAIYIYVLFDAKRHPERKRLFWLLPLQVLWVNMHIFFLIGPMIAAGFLAEQVYLHPREWRTSPLIRKLVLLIGLLMLVSCLNPAGVKGAVVDYRLNINTGEPIQIAEDAPILSIIQGGTYWGDIAVALYFPAVILLALSFAYVFFLKKQRPVFYLLASIGTAAVTYMHVRGLAMFAMLFLLAFTANCEGLHVKVKDWLWERAPGMHRLLAGIGMTGIAMVTVWFLYLSYVGVLVPWVTHGVGLTYQSDAAQFIIDQNLKGPIFNDADAGSYLIYYLYPKERVFVDNRFGDAYSADFLTKVYLPAIQNEDVWQADLKRYGFNTIFFYQYDDVLGGRQFLQSRMHDPAWALVYAGTYNVIFVRNTPGNQGVIQEFQITPDNAAAQLADMVNSGDSQQETVAGDLFFMLGDTDLAMQTYYNVVTRWPNRGNVWLVMGEVELQQNDITHSALGQMYVQKAIDEGDGSAEAYSFLGLAYLRLGQYDAGRAALKRSLSIDPDRQDAKSFLQQLDARLNGEGASFSNN